jgi:NAD(P)-dependent dehydrogenase (short-subunit alcohol dehydrogenase family)
MREEVDLSGKAVVITGSGRGIGRAVAKAVAAAGAAVVVNDVDAGPANESLDAIRAAGGRAVAHVADITVWSQAEGLIERCLDEFGKIDGLVNNAGVHLMKRSWEMDEASVRKTLEVNVLGTLACSARALKAMREQGFGSIVNTTSGSQFGHEYRPDYSASKGAVSSFTFTAAIEMKGTGVRVNAMSPNAETRMLDDLDTFMKKRGDWQRPSLPPPEIQRGRPPVPAVRPFPARERPDHRIKTERSAIHRGPSCDPRPHREAPRRRLDGEDGRRRYRERAGGDLAALRDDALAAAERRLSLTGSGETG